MAINKDKNINLQITISKADGLKLEQIQEQLSDLLNIDLSKSQTIAYLIKNYGMKATETKPQPTTAKGSKSGINWSAQIIALKEHLNVSYTRLSEILGIPPSTLKKYASGTQQPKAENEEILKNAIAKYGIK